MWMLEKGANMDGLEIEISAGKLEVSFPFNRELIDRLKVLGGRFNPKKKVWWFNDNHMNRLTLAREFPDKISYQNKEVYLESIPSYLMKHQKRDLGTAAKNPRWGFFNDTGTGKTVIGIEIIKMFNHKTLVICPKSIIWAAWLMDIDEFAPELKAVNLWKANKSTNPKVLNKALERNQVCIINFESFKTLNKRLLSCGFEMVLIDESSKIKSPKSQITKDITDFCDHIPHVYLFSGTPAPNNNMEYFSQARIIDPSLFGKSFYQFRTKYFYSVDQYGYKWIQDPMLEKDLMEKLGTISSVVRKEDVLDLPERTSREWQVEFNADEKRHYNDMAKDLYIQVENDEITAKNGAVKLMKLRQVTAGFVYDEEREIHVFGNSKLKGLMELLELEIGNKQVIIWTQFQVEATQIKDKLGDKAAICNGTVSDDEIQEASKLFKSGKLQYLIAHPKTLGHGHTLVNCSYAVYYSLSYSLEEHEQSRDRIYRKGQVNYCTYYYITVPNTIDGVIMSALDKKKDTSLAVLNYIKSLNKEE